MGSTKVPSAAPLPPEAINVAGQADALRNQQRAAQRRKGIRSTILVPATPGTTTAAVPGGNTLLGGGA